MSIDSWRKEFYPVEAGDIAATGSDIKALNHSLLKWQGLRDAAISKHWLIRGFKRLRDHVPGPLNEFVLISGESCALCQRYEEDCDSCVLYDCGPEWHKYMDHNDPEPMIKLLKSKLIEAVMNEDKV